MSHRSFYQKGAKLPPFDCFITKSGGISIFLIKSLATTSFSNLITACQRRTVKNLKRRPENDPNAGNIASVIYAGTPSAG